MSAASHPRSLLRNAEVAHILRERGKEFGFSFDNLKLDYSVAVKRSRQVSDRLTKGVGVLDEEEQYHRPYGQGKIDRERYCGSDRVRTAK